MRWVLALLMVATLARAGSIQVERAPIDLLHAQRVDITERFEIVRIEIGASTMQARASENVEMGETLPPAQTALGLGDWSYTVVMRERDPHGVPEGLFEVTLELAGETLGAVRLVQASANALVEEGATVRFGLGKDLPAAPLFVISVRELPQGPTFELASALNSGFEYVWRDDAQVENPSFSLTLGLDATFVVTDGDGTSPHNFQIVDGTGSPPTTPDIIDIGDEESLTWTPAAAGTYPYRCQYHPTMQGNIEVTE